MADTRDYQILGIWATGAQTVIPADPVSGTVYRDETVDATEFEEGWNYDTLVNSSDFNQKLFLITSVLLELDQQGVLGYNDTVDYGLTALVRGSDNILYISLLVNGPASTVVEPIGDVSGTWETLSDHVGGGGPVVSDFLSLTDTPATYAGQAGFMAVVNLGETALEFQAISGGVFNFISAPQALAASIIVAHGLGAAPSDMVIHFVNIVGDLGYSPGDVVALSDTNVQNTSVPSITRRGFSAGFDAANCFFGSQAAIQFSNKGGGAIAEINAASWNIVFKARS